jgi:5-methylcytosine-specific restriction endonuclease McrBC regulatory subunit McrC
VVRWTLERIHRDLVAIGGTDVVALSLATIAIRLVQELLDVSPTPPRRDELAVQLGMGRPYERALRQGIEAIAWIVEERGLGGRGELDGLAWQLPLDHLWETYVEGVIRKETATTGGEVSVGRLGQTTFPLHWSDPTHRSLGHLVPDIIVRRGRSVRIVDAKYKAHLAELDDAGWHRFTVESREAHRADLHQVLAYAALYDADDITATLVYPLRQVTWDALRRRQLDTSRATALHGGRHVTIELRGLPFGSHSMQRSPVERSY